MDKNHNNKRIFEDNMDNNKNKKIGTQTKRKLTEEENKKLYNAIREKQNETAKELIDIMGDIDEIIRKGESALLLNKII